MRTVVCRNAYIDASQSNVSATLRGDPLRPQRKIVKAHAGVCLHSGDVSP
jgi:hypothetical protein